MYQDIFTPKGMVAKRSLYYFLFLFVLSGCGASSSDSDSFSSNILSKNSPEVSLAVNAAKVKTNGDISLSWDSDNVSTCVASGGWAGNKDITGTQLIKVLSGKTKFTITCSGVEGSSSDTVEVTVSDPVQGVPAINLSASPTSIPYNGSTTLTWDSTNTINCDASGGWSGNKATSGSMVIDALTSNTSFTLSCSGAGGTVTDEISIAVTPPVVTSPVVTSPVVTVPVVNLSASPLLVAYNGATELNWTTSNTDNCVASGGWSGSKYLSGSTIQSNLTADKIYTLTCTGAGGTTIDSVTIAVEEPAPPALSFSASANAVEQNGSTTLNWSSSGTTSCTASGDWSGSKSLSASEIKSNLTADKIYTLTCTGAGGTTIDSVTIAVEAPAPVLSFSASANTVEQNGSTTLNWSSSDATSCTGSGDWSGSKPVSGSQVVSGLTIDSQYQLICSGAGGSVNGSVSVSVVLNSIGTALLSWTPPTENTDGSHLDDLAGYRIHYGTSAGSYSDTIDVDNPGLSSYLIENLASSAWYFSMTAVTSSGVESAFSTEVSKTIN
jgi:hypothetical protein